MATFIPKQYHSFQRQWHAKFNNAERLVKTGLDLARLNRAFVILQGYSRLVTVLENKSTLVRKALKSLHFILLKSLSFKAQDVNFVFPDVQSRKHSLAFTCTK